MAKQASLMFYYVFTIFIITMSVLCGASTEEKKAHIVYMGSLPKGQYSPLSHHRSMLRQTVQLDSSVETSYIRSYTRSFNGFVAKLTDIEKQRLSNMEGVISVFPSKTLQLHTTRSWDFIGLQENATRNAQAESDIIIGLLDTGIWPELESFNDKGFGPPPSKWKGFCEGGENFTCNNKIIGARYYGAARPQSFRSARDSDGHGSHTASTAAGNIVNNVSFFELAQGTAKGGVPSARIAAYRICQPDGCNDEDILAGFDDAIADGVDIISISVGGRGASDFFNDSIAIGAFHAMQKGILTSQSTGNSGPSYGSTSSVAPWLISVAASTTDRLFVDKVVLGDGKTLVGKSINSFASPTTTFPLLHGAQVSIRCSLNDSMYCKPGCLDKTMVKGSYVLCNSNSGDYEAYNAGALGAVVRNEPYVDSADIVALPALLLNAKEHDVALSYVKSESFPKASILKSETIKDAEAPTIASFSSRGPNSITPDIIKPDLSAPGVDILAGYSPLATPSFSNSDPRRVHYAIISGTSMACPHVSGAAAYVKTFHPDWSPSAIKSALMTTAYPMSDAKSLDGEFAYGSGLVNPAEAVRPGLVYEALEEDYIIMLCSIGYDAKKLQVLSGDTTCPNLPATASPKDLNYPSMAAEVVPAKPSNVTFRRTVTNVGSATSSYKAKIVTNSKVNIKVEPEVLTFKSLNEKKSFVVSVSGSVPVNSRLSASLVWSDGTYSVRSPIVLHA
ncbi:subtilisin-like protease SBT4.3 [Quercus robur]|uniref:subtilisin-like protease SBT4.3 n=1 Tax=Quercus robur TaxID=38942 RepID=UPI00216255BB|nr:subtilisin-like protease SBT4.3 [Quercus robur]